jgi:hypothetical protein
MPSASGLTLIHPSPISAASLHACGPKPETRISGGVCGRVKSLASWTVKYSPS